MESAGPWTRWGRSLDSERHHLEERYELFRQAG
jgi:hypothetical protein